jgi:hypothetical protein
MSFIIWGCKYNLIVGYTYYLLFTFSFIFWNALNIQKSIKFGIVCDPLIIFDKYLSYFQILFYLHWIIMILKTTTPIIQTHPQKEKLQFQLIR